MACQPSKSRRAAAGSWPALAVVAGLGAPMPVSAGTWQRLVNTPPLPDIIDAGGNDLGPGGAAAPMLLTDGSVIIRNSGRVGPDGRAFKLTPDSNGSYLNGTWTEIARLPYAPIANAQAVLPDGRMLVEGGEYTGPGLNFTLTNLGAVYNPANDTWTSVPPPAFFKDLYPPRRAFAPHPIGDAASVVLADGTFMLADKMSRQQALFDAKTMTWRRTVTATKSDLNDEEGWTLLPNGRVLTVDCYTDFTFDLIEQYPPNPTKSEMYDPATQSWRHGGSTINTLTDRKFFEIGPALLRPDGTVLALGSAGNSAIYDTHTATWSIGPNLPLSPQGYQFTSQDGPAALLPDGHVLVAASGGMRGPYSAPPVGFLEFDGAAFIPQPTIPNANKDLSGNVVLLVLPTGQVLSVDSTADVEIYTPAIFSRQPTWQPVITAAPGVVQRGATYGIKGIRFNGMSQGSAFGDENQNATNYPLVRLTNTTTHHVFYARTHDHSSMAVQSPDPVTTQFDVPPGMETGTSTLEVVANGIASQPTEVQVE